MALSGRFRAGWQPYVAAEKAAKSVEFADAPFSQVLALSWNLAKSLLRYSSLKAKRYS